MPEDAEALLRQCADLRRQGRFAEVVAVLDRCGAERALLKPELNHLARAHFDLQDIAAALSAFRAMSAFGDDPAVHRQIGGCLFKLDRFAEALVPLTRAVALDGTDADARVLLTRSLMRVGDIDRAEAHARELVAANQYPDIADAILDSIAGQRAAGHPQRPAARWPRAREMFDDLRDLSRRFLIDGAGKRPFSIGPETRIFAFGSCFAENLAVQLRRSGHASEHVRFAEIVNSTYANRYFLEWLLDTGAGTEHHADFADAFPGGEKARIRRLLDESDLVILTLGVAPCLFERGSGRFVFRAAPADIARRGLERLSSRYEFRTTSVAENVANLRRIHELLGRRGRDRHLVLTVSPVPLNASFEYASAVIADCVSKSTLRVAAEEFLQQVGAGVVYWPSFEMVRWLGAHTEGRSYGDDDGNTRHVNESLVGMIVDLFLETYAEAGSTR